MKFFILNLILFNIIICKDYIGKDDEIEINPKHQSGYVYIKMYEFSSGDNIYITFKYYLMGKVGDSISVAYTNDDNVIPRNWGYRNNIGSFDEFVDKGFYFDIDYKDYRYAIIQYSGFEVCDNCYLKISTSVSNPNITIFIIIGSIFGVVIIFILITNIIYCIKKKNKIYPLDENNNNEDMLNNNNEYSNSELINSYSSNSPDCTYIPNDNYTPNYPQPEYYGPSPKDNNNYN